MLSVIRRFFAPEIARLERQVAALSEQVGALDAERLTLLTEWTKTRDQVLRYMKRAGAIRSRSRLGSPDGDDEQLDDDEDPPVDLIREKYLRGLNGR